MKDSVDLTEKSSFRDSTWLEDILLQTISKDTGDLHLNNVVMEIPFENPGDILGGVSSKWKELFRTTCPMCGKRDRSLAITGREGFCAKCHEIIRKRHYPKRYDLFKEEVTSSYNIERW